MQTFLSASALVVGLIVLGLLIFFGKRNSRNSIFLMLSVFTIWYTSFIVWLDVTDRMLNYPHLFRTGYISAYLIFPFSYLYIRNTFYPGRLWRKSDWLLFAPALFYIIDMTPFFLSGNEYKIQIARANLRNPSQFFKVEEGWVGLQGFHDLFVYLYGSFLTVLQIRMILKNWNYKIMGKNALNRPVFLFMIALTVMDFLLVLPAIFGAIFRTRWYSVQFLDANLSIVLWAIALFLLFSPSILYGFVPISPVKESQKISEPGSSGRQSEIRDRAAVFINEKKPTFQDDIYDFILRIESLMKEKRPYLNRNYSIHDLGKDIQLPVYQISPIINQHFRSNFNSWLNKYRVDHFIALWEINEKKGLTLDALAKESGFSNRATFINAFKKNKNTTPALFLKNQSASTEINDRS